VQVGDFVIFSGATGLGGAITATVLNQEYQVQTVPSITTYTITASVNATSGDSGNGGSATVGNYQLTTGNSTFTFGTGYGAGGYGGSLGPSYATTINGGTAVTASSTTAITVVSTTGFASSGTIYIGTEGITYTAITPTTFAGTITRGVNSTAAAHANGSAIYQYPSTATGYGSPATTGVGIQIRLWSQSNYGEDLVFNPRGEAMYYWANNANPNIYDRGQIIKAGTAVVTKSGSFTPDATCPSVANFVLVSDSSRFIIAFGCNDYFADNPAAQNPLFIAWSAQENFAAWDPTDVTQQAGTYQLSNGSSIVAVQQTRQEILVFTDSALYSMQYLGPPYVWGFQIMGDNISVMGPNAVATANNITYWMGTDKFYMYSGRVETLPSALRQYVFDDINMEQSYQVFSGTSEGYNEIWWFYCSVTGTDGTGTVTDPNTDIDRYVIFNHLERTWYYGTLERTAWLDTPLRDVPMAAGYDGKIIYHEVGNDDGSTVPGTPQPIEAWVQSSDFDIGDGHNFGLVTRIIPDVTFDGSTVDQPVVTFGVRPRQSAGANYGYSNSPGVVSADNYTNVREYNVQQFTQYVYVLVRGRQMAFRVSSSDLGVAWQLGAPRIDIRPDGRR
jgi:hypothetical protein